MLSMDGLDRSNEILTRESDLCYNKVSFTGGNRSDRPRSTPGCIIGSSCSPFFPDRYTELQFQRSEMQSGQH